MAAARAARYTPSLNPMKIPNLSALCLLLASPLVLLASPATDQKIEAAAKDSYNYRTVLEDHVTVQAKDGVVTLTGTVADKDDRALAVDTVENLPGVVAVKNEIKVESVHPEKSDAWMAMKIRGRLLVRANVSADTNVEVKDGHARLTGTAANVAQKELTGIYAGEIDGVTKVTNDLVITDRPTLAEKIDDASITSQVKFALLTHKATSAVKTKVVTTDGVVLVTGEAASAAERSLVTKLARDVRGVNSVNNEMKVKG